MSPFLSLLHFFFSSYRLRYSTGVKTRIRPSEGSLFFLPKCWHEATWAVALWNFWCPHDQLWLSLSLPAKPDLVVRFSLWKGNTVCLPAGKITVWGFLTLSIMWEYHQKASAQHISVEVMGSELHIMMYNLKPHFGRGVKAWTPLNASRWWRLGGILWIRQTWPKWPPIRKTLAEVSSWS